MPCAIRLLKSLLLLVNRYYATPLSLCLVATIWLLTGCSGEGGGIPDTTLPSSTPGSSVSTSAVATLAWDPVQDSTVYGYFVHYGKQSGGGSGNCPIGNSIFVSQPSASITNLEHDTQYFFSVSAYNGTESGCSNEVTTVIPSGA